ncbi:hypothetical protein [Halomonas sp. H2]|uniref:hypothetical protein n=1 Tax=Halomonas sp. H2 TaxID=261936 RepID=UPI003CF8FAD7
MIIELFGPYATGKTTLANEAISNGMGELASKVKFQTGKEAISSDHPFFKKAIDLLLGENFVKRYFYLVNDSYMSASQKLACTNMFYASAKRYSLCMQCPEKTILEDEGLLLRGLDSTACSYDTANALKEYFSYVPLPNVVVFCSSGVEKEKERIMKRGFGINPFYSIPDESVLDEVERINERFRVAKKVLSNRKGARFLSMDLNVDGVDAFSRKLRELIG